MDCNTEITILPFRPENQAEVKALILAGLAEHFGGSVNPNKNLDLNDIGSSYANATFLVAWCEGRIVGTGALVPQPDGTAEIVRMSVADDLRRKGIGTMILRLLCEQAKADGVSRIVLETTDTWTEVIEFYKRFGFRVTDHRDGNIYFTLELQLRR
jgi:putative acetyltransferase